MKKREVEEERYLVYAIILMIAIAVVSWGFAKITWKLSETEPIYEHWYNAPPSKTSLSYEEVPLEKCVEDPDSFDYITKTHCVHPCWDMGDYYRCPPIIVGFPNISIGECETEQICVVKKS